MAVPAAAALAELVGLAVEAAADLQAEELWRRQVVVEVVVVALLEDLAEELWAREH